MHKLTPKALDDTDNIYFYSIKQFGLERGEKYYKEIFNAIQKLDDNPQLGRNHSAGVSLRAFNVGSHVIFYRTSPSGVVVSRVLHKSRDYKRHV
ncbi:type II toxin-antitoxin system RelE/ParE family toxin [Agarilytica rhodophyticola]|uniref:type II toxin-antitoxin system RelE/ParE family toxin n=1 Tax=Agarilytica rhodophyticola TaxID=1737490 RepID=UPI000B343C12|nr:type II toxin-antitoxin system RelE/ParE family toxin [Agarilytica rhodophyticola]